MKREDDELPVPAPEDGEPDAGRSSSPSPKRKGPQTAEAKRKASEAGRRGAAARSERAVLSQVRRSVAEGVGKGGAILLPLSPLPGAYMVATAEDLADTVVRLAERNPALLASLAKTTVAMDYVALGSWIAGLIVAAGVQYGRIPLDSPMAAPFGIAELYDEVATMYEQAEGPADGASENGYHDDAAAASIVG